MQTLKGTGTIRNSSGDTETVNYELEIHQEYIRSKTLDNPEGELIPGLKSIRGHITPVYFSDEGKLTLHTEDGQQFTVIYESVSGDSARVVANPAAKSGS